MRIEESLGYPTISWCAADIKSGYAPEQVSPSKPSRPQGSGIDTYPNQEQCNLKLCQRLRRYPPTLANATDAEIQCFQRWPTPTDAARALAKQALSQLSYGPKLHTTLGANKIGRPRYASKRLRIPP